jgi:hypothetical protein
VGYLHELGDSWSAEDGMVGSTSWRRYILEEIHKGVCSTKFSLVSAKVTGRTTEPSGIAAFPGTMP